MATITAPDYALPAAREEKGFFSRLGSRLVESRKRQADRIVAAYLLSLDDDTLGRLGYDRADLERRSPAGYPFI